MAIAMIAFFERLLVKIANWKFDLENLGKGHGVQHSICQISTCINFILDRFSLALTVFEILTFEIFDLETVGQDH